MAICINTWVWCDFCRMNAYDKPTKGTFIRLNQTYNSLTICHVSQKKCRGFLRVASCNFVPQKMSQRFNTCYGDEDSKIAFNNTTAVILALPRQSLLDIVHFETKLNPRLSRPKKIERSHDPSQPIVGKNNQQHSFRSYCHTPHLKQSNFGCSCLREKKKKKRNIIINEFQRCSNAQSV